VRQAVFVHIVGGSEPTSYSFILSSAQSATGGVLAYTGVDPVTPIDASGGVASAASTSITAPSITSTGANRLLVGLFATAALTTETPPSGMTERFDQQVPGTNTYKVTTAGDDEPLAAAGATGPRVALAAASGINIGQLVALTASGGGGPPADTAPPTVTTRVPAPSATNVPIGTNVTATFSEDVTNVTTSTFTLTGPGNTSVPAPIGYNPATRTATLDPTANLANGTVYTATLTSAITDTSSNANALAQVTWTFTTAAAGPPPDTTPPTVTARSPAANATGVAIGTNVTATFSEDVTGFNTTTFTLKGPGSTAVPAAVSYSAGTRTATLDPTADLTNGTLYTATLTSGIADSANNALATVTWTFTTATGAAPSGPAFVGASSAANATATTLVLPKPAGFASGDALLASVATRGAPTITPPAGWTLVRLDASGSTVRQAVYVHIAGGSEPASYTFTLSSAQSAAGGILAYTGVDPANPIDATGGQANAASTSITAPSITTTGTNRMLVGLFATAALTSETAPAGRSNGSPSRFPEPIPTRSRPRLTTSCWPPPVPPARGSRSLPRAASTSASSSP
jgi:hypothetical protein